MVLVKPNNTGKKKKKRVDLETQANICEFKKKLNNKKISKILKPIAHDFKFLNSDFASKGR